MREYVVPPPPRFAALPSFPVKPGCSGKPLCAVQLRSPHPVLSTAPLRLSCASGRLSLAPGIHPGALPWDPSTGMGVRPKG